MKTLGRFGVWGAVFGFWGLGLREFSLQGFCFLLCCYFLFGFRENGFEALGMLRSAFLGLPKEGELQEGSTTTELPKLRPIVSKHRYMWVTTRREMGSLEDHAGSFETRQSDQEQPGEGYLKLDQGNLEQFQVPV